MKIYFFEKKRFVAMIPNSAGRASIAVALTLAALSAVFFWPVLFGDSSLTTMDSFSWIHGVRNFYRESILQGEFPFWCPYTTAGTPMMANMQTQFLYPLTVIFIIFPADYALGVFAAVHQAMFAWFVWLLARECRLTVAGSWIAACCAFLSSYPMHLSGNPEHLAGGVWLPLTLCFFLGVLRDASWKKTVGLAVAGAMLVYSGGPYPLLMVMVSMLAAGVPFWLAQRSRPHWRRMLAQGAVAAALAFLLSAPQLLPTLELSRQIPPEYLARSDQAQYSLLPMDAARSLMPTVYGLPDMPVEGIFLGVTAVVLLLAGAAAMLTVRLSGRQKKGRPRAPLLAMSGLFAAGLLMAAGPMFGMTRLLALVPMVSRCYSYPGVFGLLTLIASAVLAGMAFERLARCRRDARLRGILYWCGGLGLFAALAVFVCQSPLLDWIDEARRLPRFSHDLKSATAQPEAFPAELGLNWMLLLWSLSAGVLLLLANARVKLKWPLLALTVILLADKALYVRDLRYFNPHNICVMETPSIQALRQLGADRELVRFHKTYHMLGETHLISGSNDLAEWNWIRDFLPEVVSLPWHFYLTFGGGTLKPPETDYVWSRLLDRFEPWQNDRLRGLWNTKWIMDIERGARGYSWRLRENPQFMPRAWLSSRALTVSDWREALALLLNKDFDPRGTVLLYAPSAEVPENLLRQNAKFTPVAEIKQTNNTITVRATADSDAVLVVADTWYKWWRADVDGKPARVFKANMAQKAVLFPQGSHTVRLRIVPVSFYAGCGLFVIGVALMVTVWRWKKFPLLMSDKTGGSRNGDEGRD